MTKKSTRGEFNSFVKGLVTEASPLNFPEQAASQLVNFELNKNGTLNRRLGFAFEPDHTLISSTVTEEQVRNSNVSSYVWDNAASVPGLKILVVQMGSRLKFFNLGVASVTTDGYYGEISFPSTNLSLNTGCYASVDGKLVIATGDKVVYVVQYNPNTNAFSISSFSLKTRDIWGVSDPLTDSDPSNRSGVYRTSHMYNLYNQGWNIPRKVSGSFSSPAEGYFATNGVYPSDNEKVWTGMQFTASTPPQEELRYGFFLEVLNTDSAVSRGAFIIDLLDRGQARSAAIAANKATYPVVAFSSYIGPSDSTTTGPKTLIEYAGRVFYGGFGPTQNGDARSPDLSTYIAFSRLVRNGNDIAQCYQEGDPTSREASDVVDTDGGLIRISGASNVKRFAVIGKTLLVFADNGVWSIEGGSEYGFSATNYKVDKVSTFGCLGSDSVVTDGGRAYYWSADGIYAVFRNEFGDMTYKNLSEGVIEQYYVDIPSTSKSGVRGIYDTVTKQLRWLYTEGTEFQTGCRNKELILDLLLQAYMVYDVGNLENTLISEVFVTSPFNVADLGVDIVASGVQVVVGADDVIIIDQEATDKLLSTQYVALVSNGSTVSLTLGSFSSREFYDWKDVDGTGLDAQAYLQTGCVIAGDSSVHKQTPILIMHMYRTESSINGDYELENQSGCLVRSQWDFANSANSNKWSPLFQAYRYRRHFFPGIVPGEYDNGFEVVTTRNKLRGRGRAFSIYMETEAGKDCRIIGWNLSVNGNGIA